MSLIILDHPDDVVTEVKTHTCFFHRRTPWVASFAGCTCSAQYSQRRATPEEREANRNAREAEERRREQHVRDFDAGKLG